MEQDPQKVARELVSEAVYKRLMTDNITVILAALNRGIDSSLNPNGSSTPKNSWAFSTHSNFHSLLCLIIMILKTILFNLNIKKLMEILRRWEKIETKGDIFSPRTGYILSLT